VASEKSTQFQLPNHLKAGIWKKVQTLSAVAKLCGAEPQKFGTQQYMVLTAAPKAEVVGEGVSKSPSNATYSPVVAIPRKVQVTLRTSDEFLWADEDYQLGVFTDMQGLIGIALARALDLIAIHGINPLTGALLTGSPAKLIDTMNRVAWNASTSNPDLAIEAAVGMVLADEITPNGIALAPSFAFDYATQRHPTSGQLLHPEAGFGQNMPNVSGLAAAVSSTVAGPEAAVSGGAYATTNPNVKAIIGDWEAFKWGVQRSIPIELIRYGDPDGQGDLKRKNEIALRGEVVYGVGILDLDAFSLVSDLEAESSPAESSPSV
jgi:hypothetical protein